MKSASANADRHRRSPQAPVRAVGVRLPSGLGEVQVFQRIALASLAQWQANRAGLVGPQADVEYVHQARVALRRLRSAMDLFRDALPKAWRRRWKPFWRAQARCLGVARDWDVLVTEWLPRLSAVVESDQALLAGLSGAWPGDWAQAQRGLAHAELLQRVGDPGLDRQLKAFRRSVRRLSPGGTPAPVRPRWVRRRVQRLHDQGVRASKAVADADADSRHALRIHLKRLRYTLDLLAHLLPPKRVRRYQRALVDVLDGLGQLNDLATVRRLLSSAPAQAQPLLDDWLGRQESALLARLPEVLQAWQRAPMPCKRRH